MKDHPVVFSPEAQEDLVALYDWIAERGGPHNAARYAEAVHTFCVRLSQAPYRGHIRDDVRPGLRILGFRRRVTIAFMVQDTRVVILRVFYGGQNWEAADWV